MKYEIGNHELVTVLLALDAYRWSMEAELVKELQGDNYTHVIQAFTEARDDAQNLYDRLHARWRCYGEEV